jgi:hypothetical protein
MAGRSGRSNALIGLPERGRGTESRHAAGRTCSQEGCSTSTFQLLACETQGDPIQPGTRVPNGPRSLHVRSERLRNHLLSQVSASRVYVDSPPQIRSGLDKQPVELWRHQFRCLGRSISRHFL